MSEDKVKGQIGSLIREHGYSVVRRASLDLIKSLSNIKDVKNG